MNTDKLLLTQTVVPPYRVPVFEELRRMYGHSITIRAGRESFSPTIRSIESSAVDLSLNNRFLPGRSLLWQRNLLPQVLRVPLWIAEFNLRSLSTWWAAWRRARAGRPTVFWGHSSGDRKWSLPARDRLYRCCSHFIAYTGSEATLLKERFPRTPVTPAPNALYRRSQIGFEATSVENLDTFLYVGRLVAGKKPVLLAEAFALARRTGRLPGEARLRFVGEGPESAALDQIARREAGAARIALHPRAEYSWQSLREIYARAVASVSPGYVGLSAIQSFSFGVPMLVADQSDHSPEIEACVSGFNAHFFTPDSREALAAALAHAWEHRGEALAGREAIADFTRQRYSIEAMAEAFGSVFARFGFEPEPE